MKAEYASASGFASTTLSFEPFDDVEMFVPDMHLFAQGLAYQDRIGEALWRCSSEDSPLDVGEIMEASVSMSRHSGKDCTIGMTEAMAEPRASFLSTSYARDSGQFSLFAFLCLETLKISFFCNTRFGL